MFWESRERLAALNFCPNCGLKLKDQENFCPRCGQRLGRREAAPGPGWAVPEPPQTSHIVRDVLIIVTVLLVVDTLLVVGALEAFNPPAPVNGITFTVVGDRTSGYTASFYLTNSNGQIVSSRGNVSFVIEDFGMTVLYRDSFQLAPSDYNVQNQTLTFPGVITGPQSSGPGYQWKIPASQVAPAVILAGAPGQGRAGLAFLTPTGENLTVTLIGGFTV
jgi:zinc-ribbon domain